MTRALRYTDRLYGEVELPAPIASLARAPAVQRLRDVRLSNIDSLSMPGIANISRFEHVLGAAWLAAQLPLVATAEPEARTCLIAAGLLHDAAITPFGHLMEDAIRYAGAAYDHEGTWRSLLFGGDPSQIGGMDTQIIFGRQSGVGSWARSEFGPRSREALESIVGLIRPPSGVQTLISGSMDVDNLDNVVRVAHAAGVPCDPRLPLRIARSILGVEHDAVVLKTSDALDSVREWTELRKVVYSRLMTSRRDFSLKSMFVASLGVEVREGRLSAADWRLTDSMLTMQLLNSKSEMVRRTSERRALGDLWELSELLWMTGDAPSPVEVHEFGESASEALTRHCVAYAIRDKRYRTVRACIPREPPLAATIHSVGDTAPGVWLLGVASEERRPFSVAERSQLRRLAVDHFNAEVAEIANTCTAHPRLF